MPNVMIESSDKMKFIVEEKIAKMSIAIKAMLDDLDSNSNGRSEEKISLPNVRGKILEKVIEWCVHHHADTPAADENETEVYQVDHGDQWDNEFFKMEHNLLMELACASTSLEIKGLNIAACRGMLNMIKGKQPEEIRQMLNIKNDFTPA